MPTNPQLRLGSGSVTDLVVSANDRARQVLQARARTARLTDALQTLDGNGQTRYMRINAIYRDRERVCIQTMDGTVHVFGPTQLTMVSRPLNGSAPALPAPRPVAEINAGMNMVALMQAAQPVAEVTPPAPLALEAPRPRRSRRSQGGAS